MNDVEQIGIPLRVKTRSSLPTISVEELVLPLPPEPTALKKATRTLLEQTPEEGLRQVAAGEWIVVPLWRRWRPLLAARGMERKHFRAIVMGYQNELRLWVMGERPWAHCVAGLAGRVVRRL